LFDQRYSGAQGTATPSSPIPHAGPVPLALEGRLPGKQLSHHLKSPRPHALRSASPTEPGTLCWLELLLLLTLLIDRKRRHLNEAAAVGTCLTPRWAKGPCTCLNAVSAHLPSLGRATTSCGDHVWAVKRVITFAKDKIYGRLPGEGNLEPPQRGARFGASPSAPRSASRQEALGEAIATEQRKLGLDLGNIHFCWTRGSGPQWGICQRPASGSLHQVHRRSLHSGRKRRSIRSAV